MEFDLISLTLVPLRVGGVERRPIDFSSDPPACDPDRTLVLVP